MASVITYHILESLKQHQFISHRFGSQMSEIKGMNGLISLVLKIQKIIPPKHPKTRSVVVRQMAIFCFFNFL